jgi:hypothetical protein
MMQFASPGQWGRGLYFADDSGYSHFYASKAKWHRHLRDKGCKDDEAEMMLANLLVGVKQSLFSSSS